MTYCLGWKTGTSVYISADSAVTYNGGYEGDSGKSSFGELHEKHGDYYVKEGLLKLCSFDNVIIGYAGTVSLATKIIADIKLLHSTFSLRESIKLAIDNYSDAPKIKLIIGVIENKQPILMSYNANDDCKMLEHDLLVQIGSVTSHYRDLSESIINQFIQDDNVGDQNMLICVNSVLQNYGIFDNMMEMNIGGIFFGISLSKKGVKWQEDTSYMILNHKAEMFGYISVLMRENGLVIYSTLYESTLNNNVIKIFFSGVSEPDVLKWEKKWMNDVFAYLRSGDSNYLVLYSNQYRSIAVVTPNGLINYNLIKKEADGSGFEITISDLLIQDIMKNPADSGVLYNFLLLDK